MTTFTSLTVSFAHSPAAFFFGKRGGQTSNFLGRKCTYSLQPISTLAWPLIGEVEISPPWVPMVACGRKDPIHSNRAMLGEGWPRLRAKHLNLFLESSQILGGHVKNVWYISYFTPVLGERSNLTRILIPLDWCVLKPPLVWTLLHVFFLHILFGVMSGERWAEPGVLGAGRWTPLTFHAVKPTKMVTSILNKPRLVLYW